MNPIRTWVLAAGAAFLLAPSFADGASAQTPSPSEKMTAEKINAYVGCINRLSERSYESRKRYFSWAAQSGPTGKERIIYGTYTIYTRPIARRTSRRPMRSNRATRRSKPRHHLTWRP